MCGCREQAKSSDVQDAKARIGLSPEEKRERAKASQRKSYQKNKKKINEKHLAWHRKNKEKHNKMCRDWYYRNKEKARENAIKYKEENPNYCREKQRRRRAKIAGLERERYKDIEIFERDKWICGICGKKINKELQWPDPMSRSIDHIIPVDDNGPDIKKNVRAAHLRCNQSIGTKGVKQLLLFSAKVTEEQS